MNSLIAGIVLFFGVHLVPMSPLKQALIGRFGRNGYMALFSAVSILGLGLMIWGYAGSRAGPAAADILYSPPEWSRHATMGLVLLGMISFAIYLHRGRLKLWLRNPMSIGIALWALGHLISNGKMSSVLFFGAFLLYSLLDIAVSTARGYMPQITPKPGHDVISVVAGIVLYVFFLFIFHPYVLNLPVV